MADQAALQAINNNQAPTIRIRHSDIVFFSFQNWREEESISLAHIAGVLNLFDDLTKPLVHCLHARHCQRMMAHFNQSVPVCLTFHPACRTVWNEEVSTDEKHQLRCAAKIKRITCMQIAHSLCGRCAGFPPATTHNVNDVKMAAIPDIT